MPSSTRVHGVHTKRVVGRCDNDHLRLRRFARVVDPEQEEPVAQHGRGDGRIRAETYGGHVLPGRPHQQIGARREAEDGCRPIPGEDVEAVTELNGRDGLPRGEADGRSWSRCRPRPSVRGVGQRPDRAVVEDHEQMEPVVEADGAGGERVDVKEIPRSNPSSRLTCQSAPLNVLEWVTPKPGDAPKTCRAPLCDATATLVAESNSLLSVFRTSLHPRQCCTNQVTR